MDYKYKMEVKVILESNSLPRLHMIANRIYNFKVETQEPTDPEYVAVTTTKRELKLENFSITENDAKNTM